MIPDVSIRCVDCGAPVDMTHGGARCTRHRLLDLTNGVTPAEAPRPSRRPHGEPAESCPRTRAAERTAWLALASQGETVTEIARRYGRSRETVSLVLRRASVARGLPVEKVARWAPRYLAGESSYQIAATDDVGPVVVRDHLRALGVPVRGRGRPAGTR